MIIYKCEQCWKLFWYAKDCKKHLDKCTKYDDKYYSRYELITKSKHTSKYKK